MIKAYLGLGSNIGDRELQLKKAIQILNQNDNVDVTAISPIYETDPVGYTDQPKFLNLCIEIETTLTARQLLTCCLDTEQKLHRERKIRWGPRTLDIDILLYENDIIEEDDLIVPHPRMVERAFVLIPLNDIASKQIEPRSNKTIGALVTADETVKKYKA